MLFVSLIHVLVGPTDSNKPFECTDCKSQVKLMKRDSQSQQSKSYTTKSSQLATRVLLDFDLIDLGQMTRALACLLACFQP